MDKIYMMGLITNRGMRERFLAFFKENHIHVTLTVLGAGTANSEVLDYLGLEAAEKALYNKMQIDIPGRGIAFLIPFSSIGGRKVLQYLTVGQEVVIEEESTLKNTDFELLITIANAGYIDTIMDAARSAHAPGGTVIHAKGTGAEHARKFLGISLAEEKEMIFIVVRSDRKNEIMKAIMKQAGPGTPAGAVLFSLPVTSVAGLRMPETDETD